MQCLLSIIQFLEADLLSVYVLYECCFARNDQFITSEASESLISKHPIFHVVHHGNQYFSLSNYSSFYECCFARNDRFITSEASETLISKHLVSHVVHHGNPYFSYCFARNDRFIISEFPCLRSLTIIYYLYITLFFSPLERLEETKPHTSKRHVRAS